MTNVSDSIWGSHALIISQEAVFGKHVSVTLGTAVFDPDTCIILDADLAILGAPPAAYDLYAQAIRQEFAHVPEAEYKEGRAAILTYFLNRERIYHTDLFFNDLEGQARRNLGRELSQYQ